MTAWHYWQGEWTGDPPGIMSPMDHGAWLGSTVFDGARAFEGVSPDLDRHCARAIASANAMGLAPAHRAGELEELCRDGIGRFAPGSALYIKPMYWATDGFIAPDPGSTRFCLTVAESPLPSPDGFSITVSPFRRPSLEYALTNAKAACLYPNSGRALSEANRRGFDNAVMLDPAGNVSELTSANVWMVKDGEAHTPVPNGTFLNGITRQRIIALLRETGIRVHERSLRYEDFLEADEIFSTGNYAKVEPITRIEDRSLQPGPIYARARELYWTWAHDSG